MRRRRRFSETSGSAVLQLAAKERHPLQKMEPAPLRSGRLDPKRHSTFPRQRVRGSALPLGFLPGTWRGAGRAGLAEGPPDRPRRPAPAQRRRRRGSASRAPRDSPLPGCGDSVETEVWPMSRIAGPGPAITRLFGSFDHGSARRQIPQRSFPGRCAAARRVPHLLPHAGLAARPAAAGAADPAQRMPVIPLCRLAGVRGYGGGVRGRRGRGEEGERGRGRRGGESGVCGGGGGEGMGRGEARAVRPRPPALRYQHILLPPHTPLPFGSREFRRLPFK